MAQTNTKDLATLPVGRLGLIPLESCRPLGEKEKRTQSRGNELICI